MSAPNSKCCAISIRDFYLNLKLKTCEHMMILFNILLQDMIDLCHLTSLVADDGFICIEVRSRIYSLFQVGRLAYDDLVMHLVTYNCKPVAHALGLWANETNNVTFNLTVKDFKVKYSSDLNLRHLINALESKCEITVDLIVNLCIGATLK